MTNTMNYKGYNGSVEYSDEDNLFFGKILGINDTILYDGCSVTEIKKNFRDAVEDYLIICAHMGKEPEKAYKGSFNVRIEPALHKDLAVYSASHGKTLNSTVEEAIRSYIK